MMNYSKDSQDIVKNLIESKGLSLYKFKKEELNEHKTPDFRVFKDSQFVFYCEVKCAQEDAWLDDDIMQAPQGVVVGAQRADPIFNRLTKHIHKASKQFNEVNPDLIYPNVLAFVNFDWVSDYNDLIAILTGQLIADNGQNYPIYLQYSESRIRNEKYQIHLYLWIDALKPGTQVISLNGPRELEPPQMLINLINSNHLINICKLFKIEVPQINDRNHWYKRPLP